MQLHIILYRPEMMGNVGAVMRTCVAIGAVLHLIEPLGFHWDDRVIERTSVHLVKQLDYRIYADFNQFNQLNHRPLLMAVETTGTICYAHFNFVSYSKIFLVFGSESTGLPIDLLQQMPVSLRIPMRHHVTSINLATSVAVVGFEVCRQFNYQTFI